MQIDQFDVAEHLARSIYLTDGRVSRDPSAGRYMRHYEVWEFHVMEAWDPSRNPFDEIVRSLERDRLGVAMRMLDRGVGRTGWKASTSAPSRPSSSPPKAASRTASAAPQKLFAANGSPTPADPRVVRMTKPGAGPRVATTICPTCHMELPASGRCETC
ncbi:hypothetical protein [Miniimonas arenae]|uniref:hypothetical protein n=1 Tax=Miniimonas arenae TaxID=676201 RepID=UPI0028A8BC9F|nr:hypothetical protein [Miniimonas arenae]